jgi:phosphoglycolate phosphatase
LTDPIDIIFDLDGTLIDVFERHYRAYRDTVFDLGAKPVSSDRYWELKREAAPVNSFCEEADAAGFEAEFRRLWFERIEACDYLSYDTMVPGVRETLDVLGVKHKMAIVTLRHSRPNLSWQLETLGIAGIFHKALCAGHTGAGWRFKSELIQALRPAPNAVLVGDTEADVLAAKALAMRSCAVTWGLRSRKFLEDLDPTMLTDQPSDWLECLPDTPS